MSIFPKKLVKMDIQDFFVSPLGRARDTASCTLKKLNREAVVCPWLREFQPRIHRPDVTDKKMITWDWLPQDWTRVPEFTSMTAGGRRRCFRKQM